MPPLDEPRSENRASSRVMELDKKITAFSVSHDCSVAKIYGYYASIQGDNTTFHRHLIRQFFLTNPDRKERWTAYKFTRKVYDKFTSRTNSDCHNSATYPPSKSVRSGTSVDTDTRQVCRMLWPARLCPMILQILRSLLCPQRPGSNGRTMS